MFALKNVKQNSGYLMVTQVGVLGLPAISNHKLTKIVANNSSGCSTSTKVGISSSGSSASYISGGAIQTWSTTSSTYTYNLSGTSTNTMYYMYVTNKNCQITKLTLTYTPDSIPTTSVDVTPPTVTLAPGGTQQLTTTVLPADTTDTLSYNSNATGVATVSSSGLITAIADGTATITASSGNYSDTCVVTVETPTEPFINLSLTSDPTAYTGQTVVVSALYGNGVSGLNWSVESGSVTGASWDNSGYSAKIAGTTGTLTIRATDTGSALYSEVSVSVTKTAFTTSPAASASVAEGKTTSLSAVLNSGGSINWESDDTSVATVSGGVVTGVAEGTATIIAISADDTSVTADCTVTVTEAPAEIVIDKDSITSFASSYAERDWVSGTVSGKTLSYKSSTNYMQWQKTSGANQCYISNSVATPGPITKIEITVGSGATTALDAYFATSAITSKPSSGAISQTASSSKWIWSLDAADELVYFYICNGADDTKYLDTITITYQKITLVDPTGIALDDSSSISMDTYGYGRRRLSATVSPYNANDLTVTWGTNDSSIVTVDDGVLTPVGVGTTTVYACTANYDPENPNADLIDSVSVTVTEALYKKATFTPTSISAVTQSDDYLSGGSVSLSATSAGTWNTDRSAIQLTGGKDVTFTISGYAGMKISGVDLVMRSNGGAGSGALTVTAGSTNILAIETAPFSDETWNGAYNANATDLYKVTTEYVVGSGETIKFAFSATVNSLYIHSVAVRYLDYSLEQWCGNFLSQITCDGGNPGSITDDSKWGDLGTAFAALDEDLRDIAANATADKNSSSVIEQAMARYDLILRKYGIGTGEGQHTDFIGRFGVGTVNGPLNATMVQPVTNSSSSTIVIVVVALTSITSIGVLLVIKRKRSLVK